MVKKKNWLCGALIVGILSSQLFSIDLDRSKEIDMTGVRLGSLGQRVGNVSVYDSQTIIDSGFATLPEFLQYQAGLDVLTDMSGLGNANAGQLSMRGFSAEKPAVLVVLDGVKINDPNNNRVYWDSISLANIEKIEVVRGGASTIYGSGALAGVVSITSKKEVPGNVSYTVGGYGLQQVLLNKTLYNGAKSSLSIAYDNKVQDSVRDTKYGYDSERINLSSDYQLTESDYLDFNYTSARTKYGFGGYSPDYDAFLNNPSKLQNADVRYYEEGSDGGFVGYHKSFSDDLFLTVKASNRARLQDSDIGYGIYRSKMTDSALVSEVSLYNLPCGELVVGGEVAGNYVEAGSKGTASKDLSRSDWQISAFFVENSRQLGKLNYTLGYREDHLLVDYENIYDSAFGQQNGKVIFHGYSPSLALDYPLFANTKVFGTLSNSFKAPPQEDFATVIPPYQSNPNLKGQNAQQTELGFEQTFSETLSLRACGYRMNVADEIFYDPSTYSNENIDTFHEGLELMLQAVTEKNSLALAYAMSNAYFDEDQAIFEKGNVIPLIPDFTWDFSVLHKLNLKHSLNLSAIYVGPYYAQNNVKNLERKEQGYGLLNAGYKYTPADSIVIRFDLENALNEKYSAYTSAEYASVWPAPPAFTGNFKYVPTMGRTLKATVSLDF